MLLQLLPAFDRHYSAGYYVRVQAPVLLRLHYLFQLFQRFRDYAQHNCGDHAHDYTAVYLAESDAQERLGHAFADGLLHLSLDLPLEAERKAERAERHRKNERRSG